MSWRLSLGLWAVCLAGGFCGTGTARADEKLDPTGTWIWSRELEGETNRSILKLVYKDGKLTGTYRRAGQTVPITNGNFEKNDISFEADGKFNEQKIRGKFHGKLSKDAINGNIDIMIEDNSLPLPWVAKRGVDFSDVVGTWKLKIENPNGNALEPTLKLSAEGETLKGTYNSRFGERPAAELKLQGNQLSWQIEVNRDDRKFKGSYKGQLDGDSIKGKLDYDLGGNTGSLDFTGQRTPEKPAAKTPAKPSEKATSTTAPKSAVIVQLKSRNEVVLILRTRDHKLAFSIFTRQGQSIAKEISVETLQASYPKIYEAYESSFANAWADMPMSAR